MSHTNKRAFDELKHGDVLIFDQRRHLLEVHRGTTMMNWRGDDDKALATFIRDKSDFITFAEVVGCLCGLKHKWIPEEVMAETTTAPVWAFRFLSSENTADGTVPSLRLVGSQQ